jgi:hypothetical protein
MADHNQRSTGNRRAVRNALFRELMARPPTKLRESDLYRIKWVNEGPARITTFGPPPPMVAEGMHESVSPEFSLVREWDTDTTPPPHPLVRWWRRLLWGE